MSLLSRLDAAATGVLGAVAGVSAGGVREVAAVGVADVDTGLRLTPSTRLRVASLTKPVLATAAVRAWQARGIPLDGPVLGLLSALAPDWRADRALSLRHLLSHTSGLRPDVPLAEAESYGYSPDALARAVRRTVHMGQKYRPGATWQYGNAGFGLAGFALAALVGASFEEALASELFTPARMARTGFNDAEAVGHVRGRPVRDTYWPARRAGGGLVSTVDDMLTFAEIAMADESSLRVTGVPVAPSLLGGVYGLGWNLSHGGRVRWHLGDWGGCHSALFVVPDQRLAVTVIVNDSAGLRMRRDFAWAEVASRTGLRRPRVNGVLRFAHAAGRTAVARVRRPRPVV